MKNELIILNIDKKKLLVHSIRKFGVIYFLFNLFLFALFFLAREANPIKKDITQLFFSSSGGIIFTFFIYYILNRKWKVIITNSEIGQCLFEYSIPDTICIQDILKCKIKGNKLFLFAKRKKIILNLSLFPDLLTVLKDIEIDFNIFSKEIKYIKLY